MAVQVEFLSSTPYFSGLSIAELDSISRALFEKTAEKGEMLIVEGEPAKALYFVFSGVVKFFKTSSEGKEQVLYLVRPGESFNDAAIFSGGTNLGSAEAVSAVVLYGIEKRELEAILGNYPRVAINIIRVLSRRVGQMVSLVEDLSFRHVTGRVARILLEYAEDSSGRRPRLTQQEMAAMAGTAREMIGRSLKALEEEGTIRFDRHRIVITNKEALRETAGMTN